ncbi:MAG: hypothetical protein HC881_12745 [Leptolyngbyaceae cyanobacterium SL_7_1]|nr:hypothetical protein [Leptolyngbyaceae cyanobacterium SL_7_1]
MEQYLDAVEPLTPADRTIAEEWAAWMRTQWAEHGKSSMTQQRSLMNEVRAFLKKQLGKDHIALETLDFSTEEWAISNNAIAHKVAQRNENQVVLSPETVNQIVTRATNLLSSRNWYDIAAGLAVLSGRRVTEVLKTADLELASDYSVWFTGALKRRGEETVLRYEIPTLCRAEYVLSAITKLRSIKPVGELSVGEINQFSRAVASACNEHFADIVPSVGGRDTLYTHLFRGIYLTISVYFYCPPTVDEQEFRAEIKGAFVGRGELNSTLRRTIASDRHYKNYIIQNSDGAMRKGVRLDWNGVQILKAFQKLDQPEPGRSPVDSVQNYLPQLDQPKSTEAIPMMEKPSTKRPELHADDLTKLQSLMAQRGVTGSYAEIFSAAIQLLQSQQQVESKPSQEFESIRWFQTEIDALRGKIIQLESQSSQLDAAAIQTLQIENEQLKIQLQQTQARLEGIQQLLGNGATVPIPILAEGRSLHRQGCTLPTHTPPERQHPIGLRRQRQN